MAGVNPLTSPPEGEWQPELQTGPPTYPMSTSANEEESPVKTALTIPATPWVPQTVAEHNARVDEKSDAATPDSPAS